MKTKFTLKGLEIGNIKLGEVVIETEFAVKEAWGMRNLVMDTVEKVLHKAPDYLEKVADAVIRHEELTEKVNKPSNDEYYQSVLATIKKKEHLSDLDMLCEMALNKLPYPYHETIHRAHHERYNVIAENNMLYDAIKKIKDQIDVDIVEDRIRHCKVEVFDSNMTLFNSFKSLYEAERAHEEYKKKLGL